MIFIPALSLILDCHLLCHPTRFLNLLFVLFLNPPFSRSFVDLINEILSVNLVGQCLYHGPTDIVINTDRAHSWSIYHSHR